MRWRGSAKLAIIVVGLLLLSSCTFLSNRTFIQRYPQYQGVKRVAVFVQRWPVYLQLSNQNDLGADFIKKTTPFIGPWRPAGLIDPRAVDIGDIDNGLVATLISEVLTDKGYQPFVAEVLPLSPGFLTVEEIMAKYQAMDGGIDAFLFCFYSPTVFVADATVLPKELQNRPYGLQEIVAALNPGSNYVIWAGPRAAQAPRHAISHAFIYVSLTMFRALNWQPLWEVADSQIGGRMPLNLAQCAPGPTDQNYPADAAIIQRLMTTNLTCRLHHLVPDAY